MKHYLPPVVWAFIIFVFSSIPGSKYPEKFSQFSQFFHFIEYLILGFLVLRAFSKETFKISSQFLILASFAICVIYAGLDEYHQSFIAGRSMSLMDWLIDDLGIIIGMMSFYQTRVANFWR